MAICKKCFVSGRVQGVFYRDTTRQQAVKLGLTGYAKNLADGRVKVVMCGDEDNVEKLADWLWTGSDYSSVTDVQCSNLEQSEIDQPELHFAGKFSTM